MATITMNEIIHAAVRRDLARAESGLRAFQDGDQQRAAELKRAWDFLSEMLHEHHVGEDDNVWPYLRTLGEVDPELADQMEAEHVQMAAAMARASAAMNQFVAAATEDSAGTAADAVAAAAAVTDRHLEHEEQAVMPIVVAHQETHEWKVVEKKLRGAVGKAGPFIAWLQDGMEPQFARALSGTIPGPVRLILSRVAGRSYHREIAPVWR
jgi:hemerythrin-like domain-containing protein